MLKRTQVFYTGRVQGVGFRYMARELALGFDVTGFVRNLVDGRVEMVAEGEETELQAFLQAVQEGHLASYIRNENVQWQPATGEFRGFGITY